ncbi:PAS domain S-box protein [Variovorax sp. J22G73]|uniref:PAS domain-containing hybrid sensor histidine kinase/response regulator n=1 Tax=unclassified Variovorax TaxID=663243 RepID=UPI002574DEF8|nr:MULTISPECIES: PAS domain S-box protein [unclassified Variovorax]MDM0005763.1 PAS domain S-box protein [Variovorax sp. J22R203]MDM0099790.1 PAS domain S-box protein [Variovorax sp. J22G73]
MRDSVNTTRLSAATLSEADYLQMVEAVTDYAIFFLDPEGLVISWNAGARRTTGYANEDIIGRHFSVFYPTEALDRGWPAHELEQARALGRFEDEGWRLRKDGTRFWANIVLTRLRAPDGTVRGFSKITRDLSERRQQEDMLRASEERFRLLVEGVKDYAIFMLDPQGRVASWNLGAQKNKGYTASEIIGQHFSKFYPEEAIARGWPAQELRNAVKDGRFEDEGWRVRKDGTRFWASVVITTLYDAAGQHKGFAKVTRDLTDRMRISALEDEGRRLTTFLAMLGHELRNPLAPISNALELLKREQNGSKVLERTRDILERQLKQMTRLIDDLLDVGRITSGKIHMEAKPVRLRDVVIDAVETIAPLAAPRSQTLDVQVNAVDPWVTGDSARLVQVVSNLLHNASKFTGSMGRISVVLAVAGAQAEITVKDNGPGIAPHNLQKVFDIFVQEEQDAARSKGGLGLGLSLVQQVVSLHQGSVSAFSTGRAGEGSEFVVHLPLASAPQAEPDGTGRAPGERLVLIVDDNQDAADTMALLLDVLGYATAVAHDGFSAIAAVKAKRPDLVLLDIGLPGMDGYQVAKQLRAELVDPPTLIAVTGYGQASDRGNSLDAGFHSHLVKPVDVARLEQLLQELLPLRGDGTP